MSRDAGRLGICALYRRHGFLKFNQNFFYQNIRPITKASLEEKKRPTLTTYEKSFRDFRYCCSFSGLIFTHFIVFMDSIQCWWCSFILFLRSVQNMQNWRNPSVMHIEQFWFSTFDNIHKTKWLIQQRKTLTSRNVLYENSLTQTPPAIKIFIEMRITLSRVESKAFINRTQKQLLS